MPEIYLPEKIIFKKNVLNEFTPDNCNRALMLCDSESMQNSGVFEMISNKSKKMISHVSTVVNTNIHELYNSAADIFTENEAQLIIAAGSGAAIDCGMLLSHQSGAKFTAIPCGCASALTDFETAEYYTYRHSPNTLILDPALIEKIPSGEIAYGGFATLGFAIDALGYSDNVIVRSLAMHGAIGILKNIIPAYRGDIRALEGLMYSMYFAVASHRNAKSVDKSLLSRVSAFFSQFGFSKASVCAVILPEIFEAESTILNSALAEIAVAMNIAHHTDSEQTASLLLTEKIRRIAASLAIPRAISGFGLKPLDFQKANLQSDLPEDILETCYYGSFKFMKM